MIPSRIRNLCTEVAILIFLMKTTTDAQVNIPAITPPSDGDRSILTCFITPFTLPAAWKNNDNGATITTCYNTGTCIPSSEGARYGFSATSSSIIVTISSFNSTVDTFTWKCEHNGNTATYHITVAMTRQSTAQSTLTRMAANTENTRNTAKQQRPFPLLVLLVSALLVLCSLF